MINHHHHQQNPVTHQNLTKENVPEIIPFEWTDQDSVAGAGQEPTIVGTLRNILQTFLNRAIRITHVSAQHTAERAQRAMSRLARLQVDKIERAVATIVWSDLTKIETVLIHQGQINTQEAIVHIFDTIMLTSGEPPRSNQRKISICTRTLKAKTPVGLIKRRRSAPNCAYEVIAEYHSMNSGQIVKIEKAALKKLRQYLEPVWADQFFVAGQNW
jgi:hypothetical protein